LERSNRVQQKDGRWTTKTVHIAWDADSGAEAAMLDHFRAACNVLTDRCRASFERQQTPDAAVSRTNGGSTFCFTVFPGHPHEAEVSSLLERTRSDTQALWDKVAAFNAQRSTPDNARKVTFYCGQVTTSSDDGEHIDDD